MRCPDGTQLAAWVDDELADVETGTVARHLDGCAGCRGAVRAQRQVKQATTGLSAYPEPAPRDDLFSSLLQLPAAEHRRQRADRCATGATPDSRARVAVLGAGVGAGLLAVAWLVPVGPPASPGPGAAPLTPRAPVTAPPAGVPATPAATVSVAHWSTTRD